jgi:hypothetical protein
MPALKQHILSPEYLSGYVDGEGCFTVSFSRRPKLRIGWETKPSFSVSQNEDRAQVLYAMQTYFDAGFLRRDYSDKTLKYEVRRLNDLIEKVIPHLEQFPLFSEKQQDFLLFKEICELAKEGVHLTPSGLTKVAHLAFQMNASGKRKYTKEAIVSSIAVSDEDIVHTAGNSRVM